MKHDYSKVSELRSSGLTIKDACEKLKIPMGSYMTHQWKEAKKKTGKPERKKYTKRPKVSEIEIPQITRSEKIWAFYGTPSEILLAARGFQ